MLLVHQGEKPQGRQHEDPFHVAAVEPRQTGQVDEEERSDEDAGELRGSPSRPRPLNVEKDRHHPRQHAGEKQRARGAPEEIGIQRNPGGRGGDDRCRP